MQKKKKEIVPQGFGAAPSADRSNVQTDGRKGCQHYTISLYAISAVCACAFGARGAPVIYWLMSLQRCFQGKDNLLSA